MSEVLPVNVIDPIEAPKAAPEAVKVTETPKISPAQDLRDIQALIVNGVFMGNMAPAVSKAYTLLEKMAQEIEKNAQVK